MKKTRKTTALIKDLELQIDYLCGYAPGGNHYKNEYYIRKTLIDEVLSNENTPQEVRDKIFLIQESLFKLRNGEKNTQDYLKSIESEEIPLHDFPIHYTQGIDKTSEYALEESLMDKRPLVSVTQSTDAWIIPDKLKKFYMSDIKTD